jgi:hypothetical protein
MLDKLTRTSGYVSHGQDSKKRVSNLNRAVDDTQRGIEGSSPTALACGVVGVPARSCGVNPLRHYGLG